MVIDMKFSLIKEKVNNFLYGDYYLYILSAVAYLSWALTHFTSLPFYYLGYSLLILFLIVSFIFAEDIYPFTPLIMFGMIILECKSGNFDQDSLPMALYVTALIYIVLMVIFVIKNKTNIFKTKLRNSFFIMGIVCIPVLFINVNTTIGFTGYLLPFLLIGYALLYAIFVTGHKVEHDIKRHALMILILIGVVTTLDMLTLLIESQVRDVDYMTWGSGGWTNRNIAVVSVNFAIGAVFYFISKQHSLKNIILLVAFVGFLSFGVALTCSRGGGLTYLIILVLSLIYTYFVIDKKYRTSYLMSMFIMVVCLFVIAATCKDVTNAFIHKFVVNRDDISSNRFEMWKEGLVNWTKSPIFGEGIITTSSYINGQGISIYMYHNGPLQMLCSGGIIGAICYLYNNGETMYLMIKNRRSPYSMYALILFIGMFVHSLTDNLYIAPTYMFSLFIILMGLENSLDTKKLDSNN